MGSEMCIRDSNRLSCDLPASVVDWKVNPNMDTAKGDLALLTGNLYSCPPASGFSAIFGPTLGHSTSLYEHDAAGATYECGSQAWYYPFVEAAVATLALVGAGAYTWREQRFGVALGEHYWCRRGRFFADVDLLAAVGNMEALTVGTGAVCAIGVAALLPLYLRSGSRYSCQVRPMTSPDAPRALTPAPS